MTDYSIGGTIYIDKLLYINNSVKSIEYLVLYLSSKDSYYRLLDIIIDFIIKEDILNSSIKVSDSYSDDRKINLFLSKTDSLVTLS